MISSTTFDPFAFVVAGLIAGIEQAENTYPGYRQGAAGFGKRYGATYADSLDSHLWGKALLPSLSPVPRYFRAGHGSGKHRLLYAIAAVGRCKGDDAHWQFAYSNMPGNFIGGAIAVAYYPAGSRGWSLVINRGLVVTAEGAVGFKVAEFYPDVIAHLHGKSAR